MIRQFEGCLLGAALADALGAKHEGGFAGTILWTILTTLKGGGLRWSDDTQMSLALAESLAANGHVDPDDLALRWARNREWWRGYGRGTTRILRRIGKGIPWEEANRSVFPKGSWGNGGAMRIPPVALFFHGNKKKMDDAVRKSCLVTHSHPRAIEGARILAHAITAALSPSASPAMILENLFPLATLPEYRERLALLPDWLKNPPGPATIRRNLGNGMAAHTSVVTAIYLFLSSDGDFRDLMKRVIRLRGDTDTIGTMAAALFGARHGTEALPASLMERLEARERIQELGNTIWKMATRQP